MRKYISFIYVTIYYWRSVLKYHGGVMIGCSDRDYSVTKQAMLVKHCEKM